MDWIAKALRPFCHLSILDGSVPLILSSLMSKSASLHTEMVFRRTLHGSLPQMQGTILETVVPLVLEGRMRPITTTRLDGLTSATMRAAHELVETGRTIGKVVIAI